MPPYQAYPARAYLMGREDTINPNPAAASLLGIRPKRATAYSIGPARRSLHRTRTSNPIPAAVSVLGSLGGLGKKFQSRDARDKARFAQADQLAQRATLGDAAALAELTRLSTQFATAKAKEYASLKLAEVLAAKKAASTAAAKPSLLSTPLAGQIVSGVIREGAKAARPGRGRRARYPTYVDRFGRQRYSTKPPGTEMRIPAGATPAPGTPYNFFRGAVGGGSAAQTAGQLAVAGAAGVGAYLVTKRVLANLGGRALGKEQAGVAAALAFRQARTDFKAQRGRDPNRAELAEMKRAYQHQLEELGYDPVTFTRRRSRVEEFLSDYAPED